MLIFFSVILPRKYLQIYKKDRICLKIEMASRSFRSSEKSFMQNQGGKQHRSNSRRVSQNRSYEWTGSGFSRTEEAFEQVSDLLYQDDFKQRVFGQSQSITREQWIDALQYDDTPQAIDGFFNLPERDAKTTEFNEQLSRGTGSWIFSPKKIRVAYSKVEESRNQRQ